MSIEILFSIQRQSSCINSQKDTIEKNCRIEHILDIGNAKPILALTIFLYIHCAVVCSFVHCTHVSFGNSTEYISILHQLYILTRLLEIVNYHIINISYIQAITIYIQLNLSVRTFLTNEKLRFLPKSINWKLYKGNLKFEITYILVHENCAIYLQLTVYLWALESFCIDYKSIRSY